MRRIRVSKQRTVRWLCGGLLGLGLAVAAGADPTAAPSLAPPGECAQPERELTASAQDLAPFYPVAGPPANHFTPGDVAAAPPSLPRPQPVDPGGPRQGGCDAPDAGCVGSLVGLTGRGLVESPTQPGLPPGAGGED